MMAEAKEKVSRNVLATFIVVVPILMIKLVMMPSPTLHVGRPNWRPFQDATLFISYFLFPE